MARHQQEPVQAGLAVESLLPQELLLRLAVLLVALRPVVPVARLLLPPQQVHPAAYRAVLLAQVAQRV